jgi:hypothetical protein
METLKTSDGETLFPLTLYVEATPASRSAQQANDKAQRTQDTFGPGLEKPLASYDPNTQSWKTYEATLLLDSMPFLETLPASGMTQNGTLYQLPQLVRHTVETGCSLWPTPTAVTRPMEGNVRLYRAKIQAGEMTETEANQMLGKSVREPQGKLQRWPTPTASSWGNEGSRNILDKRIEDGTITPEDKRQMTSGNGGRLNPTWVEWLMGFPTGWTDLKD